KDVALDRRVPVRGGLEDLGLPRWGRRVSLDKPVEHAAESLDAEREGRDVEEEDVLHLATQDATLDCGAKGDALHRVDPALRLAAKDLFESLPRDGHPGRAAGKDGMVYVRVLPVRIPERL